MKKNIFDTDIQMIDLDSVGDMEVDYDDFSEPNTELASNIEIAMKETQVFSADEVENALIKEAGLQGEQVIGCELFVQLAAVCLAFCQQPVVIVLCSAERVEKPAEVRIALIVLG